MTLLPPLHDQQTCENERRLPLASGFRAPALGVCIRHRHVQFASPSGGRVIEVGVLASPAMLSTTIAGSLPKPAWLAEPERLWAPWRIPAERLREAQRDAVLAALKDQEAAGIQVVTDGEQSRQHFVHGFVRSEERRVGKECRS